MVPLRGKNKALQAINQAKRCHQVTKCLLVINNLTKQSDTVPDKKENLLFFPKKPERESLPVDRPPIPAQMPLSVVQPEGNIAVVKSTNFKQLHQRNQNNFIKETKS